MSPTDRNALPELTLDAIRATAERLEGDVVATPVVPMVAAAASGAPEGCDVWLKLELFQKTGTFKLRGALNVARSLSPEQIGKGVTAVSAGNHAIAAACAAKVVGASAKLVMQSSANPSRVQAARSYGAELVFAPDGASAFAAAEALVRDEGRFFIHPFEGELTSLGTATVGLELATQIPDLQAVVIAVGGGGLASGIAAAVRQLAPGCAIYGVEPQGADAMSRSFATGGPLKLDRVSTIADSLAPPMTLPYSYGLCRRYMDDVVTVSDDEIVAALALMFRDAKLAVEPAAAAPLAAIRGPLRERVAGKRTALIVCGANIDAKTYTDYLKRGTELVEQSA